MHYIDIFIYFFMGSAAAAEIARDGELSEPVGPKPGPDKEPGCGVGAAQPRLRQLLKAGLCSSGLCPRSWVTPAPIRGCTRGPGVPVTPWTVPVTPQHLPSCFSSDFPHLQRVNIWAGVVAMPLQSHQRRYPSELEILSTE